MFALRLVAVLLALWPAALRAGQSADPAPPAPCCAAAATAYAQQLARAVALRPAQLPAVRAAAARYVQALDSLKRARFATAAAASAAYTAVEYRFSRTLGQVLSPGQFNRYLALNEAPQLAVAAGLK